MRSNKRIKIIALGVLVVSVLGLTVAYASFSSSLNIFGAITAKKAGDSWDVHFEPASGATLTPILGGKAAVATAPTLTKTEISGFNITFSAPGDSIEYDFKVVNDGILDATLTSVTIGTLSCAVAPGSDATPAEASSLCDDLTMSLTYSPSGTISASDDTTNALPSLASKDLKLVVSWDPTSVLQLTDDVTVTIGTSTFVYTQDS